MLGGGFILGLVLFLANETLEYHTVALPRVFRERPLQRIGMAEAFHAAGDALVISALDELCLSLGWSKADRFQFHPDDHLWDVYRAAFPRRRYPDCLGKQPLKPGEDEYELIADKLLQQNATLREYVRAGEYLIRTRSVMT